MNAADAPELVAARKRVDETTRAAREARIEAAEPLRERARRRSRLMRYALMAAALGAVVLLVVATVAGIRAHGADRKADTDATVLTSARGAITAMLTADPAHADDYVDRVLGVTTGAQHERLATAREALAAEVTRGPSGTGQVLSAGLIDDPPDDREGSRARVLIVAEATNPGLIGGDVADRRVTVDLTMLHVGQGWRVERAVLA